MSTTTDQHRTTPLPRSGGPRPGSPRPVPPRPGEPAGAPATGSSISTQARPRFRTYRPTPLPPAAPPPSDPLRALRVIVVGVHHLPEPTAAAECTASLAEQLAVRAASVTVLSGVPHDPEGLVDQRYRGHRRLVQPPPSGAGPTVVRLGHHVPERRTRFAGARYEMSFARRAMLQRLPQRPDLVVGVMPSPGGAAASARIARRHGVPLVVVVQDVSDGDPRSLPCRLEGYALRSAARIAVTDAALGDVLAGRGLLAATLGAGADDVDVLVHGLLG